MSVPSARLSERLLQLHLIALVVLSVAFGQTGGLAYLWDGEPRFTSELQSSGGDDNESFVMGVGIFSIALLITLVRTTTTSAWCLKCIPLGMLWLFQLGLIPPEVGDLRYTIVETGNVVLAAWLVAFATLPFTLMYSCLERLRPR